MQCRGESVGRAWEADRTKWVEPMCLECVACKIVASQSTSPNPVCAYTHSPTRLRLMNLSPGLSKTKTKWKRLARQLGHTDEQRLASRKRIAKVLQASSQSMVQRTNQCLFEVNNDFDSTTHMDLAEFAQQPRRNLWKCWARIVEGLREKKPSIICLMKTKQSQT